MTVRLIVRADFKKFNEYMSLKPAIICDLDGTLALIGDRNPYDASRSDEDPVNEPIAEIVKKFSQDHDILLVSGRSDKYKSQTQKFLEKNKIEYDKLLMRKEGDYRKDTIVKQEFWKEHIKPNWQVKFVLDDRNQVVKMWREIGLTCLQVAPGDF